MFDIKALINLEDVHLAKAIKNTRINQGLK